MLNLPSLATLGPAQLAADARGTTVLEFALVAPILSVLLLGSLDFGHTLYMQSVLQGTVQKAARDSSLETGTTASIQTALDTAVSTQLKKLNRGATVTFSRRYYRTFSLAAAAQAETFVDTATGTFHDGVCNNGESYTDANNNGVWDADGGDSGQGSAKDNVIYKVTISYRRMFPIDKFIGGSGTTTLSAQTVLANQPYGDQASYGTPTVRQCT